MSFLRGALGVVLLFVVATSACQAVDFVFPFPSEILNLLVPISDLIRSLGERWPVWMTLSIIILIYVCACLIYGVEGGYERFMYYSMVPAYFVPFMFFMVWLSDDEGLPGAVARFVALVGIPPSAPDTWPVWAIIALLVAHAMISLFVVAIALAIALMPVYLTIRWLASLFSTKQER